MAANPLAAQIFQLDGAIMFQIRSHSVKLTMSLILEDVCTV